MHCIDEPDEIPKQVPALPATLSKLEVHSLLRLEDWENQSYPLALSRILGITSLPREEDYGL